MIPAQGAAGGSAMVGRQDRDQGQLFCEFSFDERRSRRRIRGLVALAFLRE